MVSRRTFLVTLGGAAASTCEWNEVKADKKKSLPNILFILTDDQAAWAVGAYGNTDIHTPNMDRLAREGVRFCNAFTCPVCSPSRGMILSGRYPHQIGLDDYLDAQETQGINPKIPLLPEILKQAGYATGLIGKWHLGQQPEHHPLKRGFDFFWGFVGGGIQPLKSQIEIGGKLKPIEGYLINRVGEEAVSFIKNHRDRPFALFVHTREPHSPYTPVPEEDAALYTGKILNTPKVEGIPEDRLQKEYHEYYASISSVDRNLGRILHALDEVGLTENTLVVFMGDNGYMIGHHGLETKGNGWMFMDHSKRRPNMFEESIRVPLIIRWPAGLKSTVVNEEQVCSVDLFPTFTEILKSCGANFTPPDRLEGKSFLPLIQGNNVDWRKSLFLLYDMHHGAKASMRMIRTPEWKLILHLEENGKPELYHLLNDPHESQNRYGDSAITAIQKTLREQLHQWQKQVKDPLATD